MGYVFRGPVFLASAQQVLAGITQYQLKVSADAITADYASGERSIHPGLVRTVIERRPGFWNLYSRGGLLASERTPIDARMWGGVFIPADLPEYPEIRRVVEGWRLVQPPGFEARSRP